MENTQTQEVVKLDYNSLPDLSTAEVDNTDLCSAYWTPEIGESKRMFFIGFKTDRVQSINNPTEKIDLDVVVFIEKDGDNIKAITNGAARLVSTFTNIHERGQLKQGDAFQITLTGEEKNKNNNFKSQTWSIKRILISK